MASSAASTSSRISAVPPETLRAALEASLKAVAQIKQLRDNLNALAAKQEASEKLNEQRWQSVVARLHALEQVPQSSTLPNGHLLEADKTVVKTEEDEDDDQIPALARYADSADSDSTGTAEPVSGQRWIPSSIVNRATPKVSATSSVSVPSQSASPRLSKPTSPTTPTKKVTISPSPPQKQSSPTTPTSQSTFTPLKPQMKDSKPNLDGLAKSGHERKAAAAGAIRKSSAPVSLLDMDDDDVFDVDRLEGSQPIQHSASLSPVAKDFAQSILPSPAKPLATVNGASPPATIPVQSKITIGGRSEVILQDARNALAKEAQRLQEWEKKLAEQAQEQDEIKKIQLDHEEELDVRLAQVEKREARLAAAEAKFEAMRSRNLRPHEVDAQIYRRVEEARGIRELCKRRAEDLNEAEKAWCLAKNVEYVPVIKDGEWPFGDV